MKASKGAAFEREVCGLLSMWWSGGERDDVFWRTSGSGGRATRRLDETFGQYGDIQAVHPSGDVLMEMCTLELKRGYDGMDLLDVMDKPDRQKDTTFEEFIEQAKRQRDRADSYYWWLIIKRDGKDPLIFVERDFMKEVHKFHGRFSCLGKHHIVFNLWYDEDFITGVRLRDFLHWCKPSFFHWKKACNVLGREIPVEQWKEENDAELDSIEPTVTPITRKRVN